MNEQQHAVYRSKPNYFPVLVSPLPPLLLLLLLCLLADRDSVGVSLILLQ